MTEPVRRLTCLLVAVALTFSVAPAGFAATRSPQGLRSPDPSSAATLAELQPDADAVAVAEPASVAEAATTTAEPTTTSLPTVRLQDDDLRLGFSGTWAMGWASHSSGRTHRVSKKAGSYAVASFEGTGAALVSRRGPNRGRANIYVDGALAGSVDLYAKSTGLPSTVWRSEPLPEGRHEVRIVVRGTKSTASSDEYVVVDALDVVGSVRTRTINGTWVNSGSSKLAKLGSWWVSEQSSAYGGSAWRSARRGATVTLRFKGTRFAWIGRKSESLGKAEVIIDGKKVATVSQYRSATSARRIAYAKSGLPYGTHNVTIRVLGSASTGDGTNVDVDAFIVNGTPLKAYSPTPFSYTWKSYLVIDKSRFKLYWVKDGWLIKSYPIAIGRPSMPTPSRVWRIDAKYHTDPSSVYGPRKMRMFERVATSSGFRYEFTRYAIHGTNEPWVIGTMASHGCIRMRNSDVLDLFPRVPLHTMVVTRD